MPAEPVADDERGEAQVAAGSPATCSNTCAERAAGDLVVAEVVAELAELVEHEVVGILRQLVAGVVDLLDVALGADACG